MCVLVCVLACVCYMEQYLLSMECFGFGELLVTYSIKIICSFAFSEKILSSKKIISFFGIKNKSKLKKSSLFLILSYLVG